MARRHVDDSSPAATTTSAGTTSRTIQRERYYINRSLSAASLTVSSSSASSKKSRSVGTETGTAKPSENNAFDNVMMIAPSSPCGTPPRGKRWEGAFGMFLRGKSPQHPPSLSSSPSSSNASVVLPEDMSTGTNGSGASHSTTGATKGSKKKSSFSLIPGSKRLVSRNAIPGKQGSLSSIFSKGSGIGSSGRISRGHKSMDALDTPLRNGLERTRSGSKSETVPRRRNKSLEETPSTSAAAATATALCNIVHFPSSVAESIATGSVDGMESQRGRGPECDNDNDNASTTTARTHSLTPPTVVTSALYEQLRDYSNIHHRSTSSYRSHSNLEQLLPTDRNNNPVVNEGEELPNANSSAPCFTQFQRTTSSSRTYISRSNSNSRTSTPVRHCYLSHHDELDLRNMPAMPSLKVSSIYNGVSSSDKHDVGLDLDDSDNNSHMDCNHVHQYRQDESHLSLNAMHYYSTSIGNSNSNTTYPDCGRPEPPDSLDEMFGGTMVTVHSSSSSHLLSKMEEHEPFKATSPNTKKMFTKIHNSSEYGKDSNSPFLGGRKASNRDLAGAYRSYSISKQAINGEGGSTFHGSLPRSSMAEYMGAQANQVTEESPIASASLLSKSVPLSTFGEGNPAKTSLRKLKPIQSAESWVDGRRYLIAPAALAASSFSTIHGMSGLVFQSATEAATSEDPFGTIELGDAYMTYVGDKYHLSCGKWSSCRLVLRQNYLLEYDPSLPLTSSSPIGIAHLEHATAHVKHDFDDALELHFYASPCAKFDQRVLLIRVKNKDERDHWITCLNSAAKLRVNDLWEVEEDRPLGSGRYATIFPARRKIPKTTHNNTQEEDRCDKERSPKDVGKNKFALKVIDKTEFWRQVIKKRERRDTIVREIAVQSTLTAKFGTNSTLLQIHGYFETSEKVVIELELLDGRDLFDYISSKGVLEEEEACYIVRTILLALHSMNQAGIAHRDIKPANILMTKSDESKYGMSVKIGDFGMSAMVGVDGLVRGRCGSPGYVAPEIFEAGPGEGYENRVDIFSAGVTLYLMLCGYEPFYGETEKELIKANKNARLDFPESEWGGISRGARDLVSRMLKTDPKERITAKDALEHPWILQLEQNVICNTDLHSESILREASNPAHRNGVCSIM